MSVGLAFVVAVCGSSRAACSSVHYSFVGAGALLLLLHNESWNLRDDTQQQQQQQQQQGGGTLRPREMMNKQFVSI
ncbi:unnamed protein product [Ectocarpus sp. 12 AP-2014]